MPKQLNGVNIDDYMKDLANLLVRHPEVRADKYRTLLELSPKNLDRMDGLLSHVCKADVKKSVKERIDDGEDVHEVLREQFYPDPNDDLIVRDVARDLLDMFPKWVDTKGPQARTPLMWALQHKRLETAQTLLRHGANPNHETLFGKPAVAEILRREVDEDAQLSFLKRLLERGELNQNSKSRLLSEAALIGRVEVCRMLMAHGADGLHIDQASPVMMCAKIRNIEALHTLHTVGADFHLIDAYGRSAIHYMMDYLSSRHSEEENAEVIEIVRFLMDNGLSIDAKENADQTPLDILRDAGRADLVAEIENIDLRADTQASKAGAKRHRF